MKRLVFLSLALFLILKVCTVYGVRPFTLYSIRPMGMGNAFTAVADDYNAIYFNPAGIAQIDRFDIDVPWKLMMTQETMDLLREIGNISDKLKESEGKGVSADFEEALSKLLDLTEDTLGWRSDLSLGWILPSVKIGGSYFGIGLGSFLQFGVKTYIQPVGLPIQKPFNLLNDELIIQGGIDGEISGSISMMTPFRFISGNSSIGITIKSQFRKYLNNFDDPLVFANLLKEDVDVEKHLNFEEAKTKSGIGIDLGWMGEYSKRLRFGFMIKDIINTLKVEPNFRIGMAIKPMKSFTLGKRLPPIDVIFAIDLDNLNNKDRTRKKNLLDKLHLGSELKIAPFKNRAFIVSLRLGNNQGFFTLGAGIKLLWLLNADYAYYGDHIADWHTLSLRISI